MIKFKLKLFYMLKVLAINHYRSLLDFSDSFEKF